MPERGGQSPDPIRLCPRRALCTWFHCCSTWYRMGRDPPISLVCVTGTRPVFRGRRGIFTCGTILDGICCLSPRAPALRQYDRCYWPMRIVLCRVARRCFGGCEASVICIMVTSWRA